MALLRYVLPLCVTGCSWAFFLVGECREINVYGDGVVYDSGFEGLVNGKGVANRGKKGRSYGAGGGVF